jgi:hypothetical protein
MLPIIVAGSRPAVAGLAQSQHFDCDTSADLHRLRRASITETARSRVSFASTVLLNPIGSYRLPHPHQPNRHRARRTASRIPSRDFLLWRFANAGPQAAEFAATSVTGRHPKTFTKTEVGRRNRDFRFTPESRHQADIAGGPKSANSCHRRPKAG